jgi:hypothetical protein
MTRTATTCCPPQARARRRNRLVRHRHALEGSGGVRSAGAARGAPGLSPPRPKGSACRKDPAIHQLRGLRPPSLCPYPVFSRLAWPGPPQTRWAPEPRSSRSGSSRSGSSLARSHEGHSASGQRPAHGAPSRSWFFIAYLPSTVGNPRRKRWFRRGRCPQPRTSFSLSGEA